MFFGSPQRLRAMSLIHNERTKLMATAINSVAVSCFTVGVLAPTAAAFYNVGSASVPQSLIVLGALIWIFAALTLHLSANRILGRLKE